MMGKNQLGFGFTKRWKWTEKRIWKSLCFKMDWKIVWKRASKFVVMETNDNSHSRTHRTMVDIKVENNGSLSLSLFLFLFLTLLQAWVCSFARRIYVAAFCVWFIWWWKIEDNIGEYGDNHLHLSHTVTTKIAGPQNFVCTSNSFAWFNVPKSELMKLANYQKYVNHVILWVAPDDHSILRPLNRERTEWDSQQQQHHRMPSSNRTTVV